MKNILICILCLYPTFTQAQDSTNTKKVKFWATFGFGRQWTQVEEFNKKLTNAGFNSLNAGILCGQTALGISSKKHNVLMFLGFASGLSNSINSNNSNNQTSGFSQLRIDVLYGYELNFSKYFILMPIGGINTQNNSISVQKNTTATTFTNALSSPLATGTTITGESFGATIGIRFIYKLRKKSIIALNVMYSLPISNYNWKSNAQDLQDVPKVNLGGFSAGVAFGFN